LKNIDIFYGPFGIFYGHLGYFMVIWYILCSFGTFFRVLVTCTEKNLATLSRESFSAAISLPTETNSKKSVGCQWVSVAHFKKQKNERGPDVINELIKLLSFLQRVLENC
jgi:hypothetical protein